MTLKDQQRASTIRSLGNGPLRQLSVMAGSLKHPAMAGLMVPGNEPRRTRSRRFADRSTGLLCASRLAVPAEAQSGPVPLAKRTPTSAFSHAP